MRSSMTGFVGPLLRHVSETHGTRLCHSVATRHPGLNRQLYRWAEVEVNMPGIQYRMVSRTDISGRQRSSLDGTEAAVRGDSR